MRRQFYNSFWLLLLLGCLAVKSVVSISAVAKTNLPNAQPKSSQLSGRVLLSNLEAEESSSLNEVSVSYKLPFAEVAFHLHTHVSINPPRISGFGQKKGTGNIIPPFYRYILYPFHAFW